MGVCYLYGNGGESNAALVNVVGGTTQPTNPTYGTIWCQTSTAINGWEIFSVSPAWEAAEGHIYLQSVPTTSGDIPNFSALDATKKPYGFVWVQISGVKQRINGAWTFLNAYMWRDNTWTQISKAFPATLNITYPAASVCTAKNETVTFTAPNTTGAWSCPVHNNGTWTVSCTDGSQSKTANVNISTDGETKSVALSYFSATVSITYPAGSTCTATSGSTTLKAPNTNGSWSFTVTAAGTWTVEATDSTRTYSDTKTATVSTSGQTASVSLGYTYRIFYYGNTYSGFTGGWVARNIAHITDQYGPYNAAPSVATQSNGGVKIYMSNTDKSGIWTTGNKINLAGFKTLTFNGNLYCPHGWGRCQLDIWSNFGTYSSENVVAKLGTTYNAGTYTLDISSLTGSYYIGIRTDFDGYAIVNEITLS